jgi:hypothetical protein
MNKDVAEDFYNIIAYLTERYAELWPLLSITFKLSSAGTVTETL